MFGHDKTQDGTDDTTVQVSVVPSSTDNSSTPPAPAPQDEMNLPAPAFEVLPDEPEELGAPEVTTQVSEETPSPVPATEPPMAEPMSEAVSETEMPSTAAPVSSTSQTNTLSGLRQEALQELSSLINHLDQTPEEKYATAKMVYEETNDQTLLTSLYEAAKNLSDEKAKAAAIYDVIQKINEQTASN